MSLYLYPYPRRMARRMMNRPEQHQLNVNIREEDDAYILSALVPGLKAEDLNIQVLDDVLRIEGEYKADDVEYMMNELPSGSFTRTLRLPTAIDAEHVEARITDGVLNLHLPKTESAKPKKIKVAVK
ncbi:MAG: Hsp20/alpha crystallin family protein [Anaerolineales bacterium]|nr:Hsp20/alpha crystallin family protein [Anaerolineales bacterium]